MLSPKRVKWRKQHRTTTEGKAHRGATLSKGEFGLMAVEGGWITARQIEAARVAMTRYTKRGGDVFTRLFPDRPITKKAAETRMGSGKGNVEYWVAVVQRGRMIWEMSGVTEEVAREALRLAAHKLPIKTKFVSKKLLALQATQKAKEATAKATAGA